MRRAAWRGTFVSAAVAAALLASALCVLVAARVAVRDLVQAGMPDDAIVIAQGTTGLGLLQWSGRPVPAAIADELRARPDVTTVSVEEAIGLPSRVSGSLFGYDYGSDVIVVGIDSGAISWMAPGLRAADFVDTWPLPAIAPGLILDAYNNSFAGANGLPRLEAGAFVGRHFTLEIGASSLCSVTVPVAVRCRLFAFTPRRDVFGVIVPLDFVRRMNELPGATVANRRIIAFARTPDAAGRMVDEMRDRGFSVSAPSERLTSLRRIEGVMFAVTVVFALAVVALVAISAHFAGSAHILARRQEAELLHQLAWSRSAMVRRFAAAILAPALKGALFGATAATLLAMPSLGLFGASFGLALDWTQAVLAGLAAFVVPVLGAGCGALLGARTLIPAWERRGGA